MKAKFGTRDSGLVVKISFVVFFLLAIHFHLTPYVVANDKWPGVDESVVEKYAMEHGREAREPFINTDQGDLLLFVFLLAGSVGGFLGGYSWRMLVSEKRSPVRQGEKG